MYIPDDLYKEIKTLKSYNLSMIEIMGRIRRKGASIPFVIIQNAYRQLDNNITRRETDDS